MTNKTKGEVSATTKWRRRKRKTKFSDDPRIIRYPMITRRIADKNGRRRTIVVQWGEYIDHVSMTDFLHIQLLLNSEGRLLQGQDNLPKSSLLAPKEQNGNNKSTGGVSVPPVTLNTMKLK